MTSNMFSGAALATALLFASACSAATLPPPPAGMQRIAVTYDADALGKAGGTWMLPQLYVIDVQTGQAASDDVLPDALRDFVTENRTPPKALAIKATANKTLLDGLMAVSRHPNNASMKKAELDGKRFAIFQLWADWCTGCLQEAKQLSDLLVAHPMRDLAWVAVEADPTKGKANVEHVKDARGMLGPHGKPLKVDSMGRVILDADGELVEE